MDVTLAKTPVDIKTLIETSDITTYDKTKLIQKIQNNFDENEQNLYVCHMFLFLNYHPINDFVINLENVWKFIGFANKGNAKRLLKHHFIENKDYKTALLRTEKQLFRSEKQVNKRNTGGSGLNHETIMLNVNTFKKLCLKANTESSDKIHDYYIKLEMLLNDLMKEESDEIQQKLKQKDEELEHTKNELQKMSICRIKKWYNVDPGDTVYAFKNDGQPYVKIGKAENLKKREDGYTVGNRTSNIFYYRKCYNCKLTERVIHHMLDKFRLENNREWFDISDELAIYVIDIVCDFLDGYISCSEELINLNVKEHLSISFQKALEIKKKNNISEDTELNNLNNVNNIDTKKEKKTWKNHVKKIIEQEDDIKIHFDKFVKEFCEIGDDKKCLSLEILGAYRMWNKKVDTQTKNNLMNYMKNNYTLKKEYIPQHSTKLTYYTGIQPNQFIIKPENINKIPYYEEFVLSECKFDYTYRTTKTILFNEFKQWVSNKYPSYIFSKQDQIDMESYLNRTFCNCRKIHINGGVNGFYGLQMKNDNVELLGIALSRRKKVYKIDLKSKDVIESYDTLYAASVGANIDEKKLSQFIINKVSINNEYIYSYDDNA